MSFPRALTVNTLYGKFVNNLLPTSIEALTLANPAMPMVILGFWMIFKLISIRGLPVMKSESRIKFSIVSSEYVTPTIQMIKNENPGCCIECSDILIASDNLLKFCLWWSWSLCLMITPCHLQKSFIICQPMPIVKFNVLLAALLLEAYLILWL